MQDVERWRWRLNSVQQTGVKQIEKAGDFGRRLSALMLLAAPLLRHSADSSTSKHPRLQRTSPLRSPRRPFARAWTRPRHFSFRGNICVNLAQSQQKSAFARRNFGVWSEHLLLTQPWAVGCFLLISGTHPIQWGGFPAAGGRAGCHCRLPRTSERLATAALINHRPTARFRPQEHFTHAVSHAGYKTSGWCRPPSCFLSREDIAVLRGLRSIELLVAKWAAVTKGNVGPL